MDLMSVFVTKPVSFFVNLDDMVQYIISVFVLYHGAKFSRRLVTSRRYIHSLVLQYIIQIRLFEIQDVDDFHNLDNVYNLYDFH